MTHRIGDVCPKHGLELELWGEGHGKQRLVCAECQRQYFADLKRLLSRPSPFEEEAVDER